jgi:hypothetical protein
LGGIDHSRLAKQLSTIELLTSEVDLETGWQSIPVVGLYTYAVAHDIRDEQHASEQFMYDH